MIERIVSLDIQKAYEEMRSILLENNCRIIMEELLKSIIVEHGYPSSLSPRETWKRISFYLFPDSRNPDHWLLINNLSNTRQHH